VAALAWAHGLTVAQGRELLLVTPASPAVLRVLTLAGLDHFIPHFAHLTAALEHATRSFPGPYTGSSCPPQPAEDKLSYGTADSRDDAVREAALAASCASRASPALA
jgi:hypothetical protein